MAGAFHEILRSRQHNCACCSAPGLVRSEKANVVFCLPTLAPRKKREERWRSESGTAHRTGDEVAGPGASPQECPDWTVEGCPCYVSGWTSTGPAHQPRWLLTCLGPGKNPSSSAPEAHSHCPT